MLPRWERSAANRQHSPSGRAAAAGDAPATRKTLSGIVFNQLLGSSLSL